MRCPTVAQSKLRCARADSAYDSTTSTRAERATTRPERRPTGRGARGRERDGQHDRRGAHEAGDRGPGSRPIRGNGRVGVLIDISRPSIASASRHFASAASSSTAADGRRLFRVAGPAASARAGPRRRASPAGRSILRRTHGRKIEIARIGMRVQVEPRRRRDIGERVQSRARGPDRRRQARARLAQSTPWRIRAWGTTRTPNTTKPADGRGNGGGWPLENPHQATAVDPRKTRAAGARRGSPVFRRGVAPRRPYAARGVPVGGGHAGRRADMIEAPVVERQRRRPGRRHRELAQERARSRGGSRAT